MRNRWIALGLCAVAVGCGSRSTYYDRSYDPWAWSGSSYQHSGRDRAPRLSLSEAEVAAALQRQTVAPIPLAPTTPPAAPPRVAAAEVVAAYGQGDRALARELVAAHPGLVDWQDGSVVVSCRYVGGWDGGVELTCVRADTSLGSDRKELAVCFEPGTYGVPADAEEDAPPLWLADRGPDGWNPPDQERRYRHWPKAQDLAFLRAPVVVIPAGQDMATARVPVACASFHRGAPQVGQPYALSRFPEGSAVDRLMVVLCQGERVPGDAEAQLAVWLARDDISWAQFVAEGGDRGRLVTFGQMRSVRATHADGAARLLLRAGVDPRERQFWGATEQRPAEAAPAPPPEPRPAPAPQAEPPAEEPSRHLS